MYKEGKGGYTEPNWNKISKKRKSAIKSFLTVKRYADCVGIGEKYPIPSLHYICSFLVCLCENFVLLQDWPSFLRGINKIFLICISISPDVYV